MAGPCGVGCVGAVQVNGWCRDGLASAQDGEQGAGENVMVQLVRSVSVREQNVRTDEAHDRVFRIEDVRQFCGCLVEGDGRK